MSTPARFSLWFLGFVVVLASLVAALNIVFDPYLVFDRPRIAGFNARKPAAGTHERWMKAFDAPRHDASTVLLGSSRSGIGIDPHDTAWPATAQPVYNLSIAGSKTREDIRYLKHFVALASDATKPRTVIVGLDFEYFLSLPERAQVAARLRPGRGGDDDERMATLEDGSPNPERRVRVLKDYLTAALTFDAVSDSIATFIDNRRARVTDLEADGHLTEASYQTIIAYDGVSRLFDENNRQFITNYGVKRQVLDTIAVDDAIDGLLTYAKSHGMHVVLYVQPAHADRFELMDRLGYWEPFERWKRDLTRLVDDHRRDGAQVELWDFAGYEPYELEPIPAPADRAARLRWFWEPGHYTTALGGKLVGRLTGSDRASDFGVELTPQTIDARLAQVRTAREAYRSRTAAATVRIDELVCARLACTGVRSEAQARQ